MSMRWSQTATATAGVPLYKRVALQRWQREAGLKSGTMFATAQDASAEAAKAAVAARAATAIAVLPKQQRELPSRAAGTSPVSLCLVSPTSQASPNRIFSSVLPVQQ